MFGKSKSAKNKKNALTRKIKRIISHNEEIKAFDQVLGNNMSTSYTIVDLSNIGQGVTDKLRLGNQIDFKSLEGNMEIYLQTAGTAAFAADYIGNVRIIIFQDHAGNSTPTGNTGVVSTDLMAGSFVNSLYNFETRNRYTILYDRIIQMYEQIQTNITPAVAKATTDSNFKIKLYGKKLLKKINYVDATAALPSKGRIYIAYFIDHLATTEVVTAAFTYRIKFTDS